MLIKGKDIVKLLDIMQDVLEVIWASEQNNSDDESFDTLTSFEILRLSASMKPEESLDINFIAHAIFDALEKSSDDTIESEIAVKIINALNTDFNKKMSCLDLLLSSLVANAIDTADAFAIVDRWSKCLQNFVLANIPNADKLLTSINTHKLYLELQQWEMLQFLYENEDHIAILSQSKELLFNACDELLLNSPHEFKKMLAHKGFPGLFLLSYLENDYRRELAIMKLSYKMLIKKLVTSVSILLDSDYYSQQTQVGLSKIGIALETVVPNEWDFNENRKILMPLIIKLIHKYSDASTAIDNSHIYNTIVNFISLLDDINSIDANGNTALHAAISQGCSGNIKLGLINWLLSNGASVDIKNSQGDTPLSLAIKYLSDENSISVVSALIKGEPISLSTLEQGLYEEIYNSDECKPLTNSKNFRLLADELINFPEWSCFEFFEKNDLFPFDNAEKLDDYNARHNIRDVTKFIEAIQYFNVPFNNIIKTKINAATAPAMIGALLANSHACDLAQDSNDNNIFKYLKLHPQLCHYLNADIDDVMTTLLNINPESDASYSDKCFATSYDILKICRFDDNDSPEYLLFALRILVERVFSTQFIPGSVVVWLSNDSTLVVQDLVKQQLKNAVFSLIKKGINIEPIKEYLTKQGSGINTIFFSSFVHNFLIEIEEREIKHQLVEVLLSFSDMSSSLPSTDVYEVDFETGKDDKNISKFASRNKLTT